MAPAVAEQVPGREGQSPPGAGGATGVRRLVRSLRGRSLRPGNVVPELRTAVRLGTIAVVLACLSLLIPSNTWLGAEPVVGARVDSVSRAVLMLLFVVL